MKIEQGVKELISALLKKEALVDTDGYNRTFGWDSLKHIEIITELEAKFEIAIPDEMIAELINIEKIVDFIVKTKGESNE